MLITPTPPFWHSFPSSVKLYSYEIESPLIFIYNNLYSGGAGRVLNSEDSHSPSDQSPFSSTSASFRDEHSISAAHISRSPQSLPSVSDYRSSLPSTSASRDDNSISAVHRSAAATPCSPRVSETALTCLDSATTSSAYRSSLDQLLDTFVSEDNLSTKQVVTIYELSGSDFDKSMTCLLDGPTLQSIIKMINGRFVQFPRVKLSLDAEDMWGDMVAQYKCPSTSLQSQLRITLNRQPAVDTGGVRRQVYSTIFEDFATNKYIRLFDGPMNHIRPAATAEARSSGLLKVLGSMISHSISQDGIGFPFLSPTCYWYLVGGEEKAIEFITTEDLPADSASVVTEVCISDCMHRG